MADVSSDIELAEQGGKERITPMRAERKLLARRPAILARRIASETPSTPWPNRRPSPRIRGAFQPVQDELAGGTGALFAIPSTGPFDLRQPRRSEVRRKNRIRRPEDVRGCLVQAAFGPTNSTLGLWPHWPRWQHLWPPVVRMAATLATYALKGHVAVAIRVAGVAFTTQPPARRMLPRFRRPRCRAL
jgi:hypothetical protein